MRRTAFLALALTSIASTNEFSEAHLRQLKQEAVMMGRVGLYDEAEVRCNQILSQTPDDPTMKQLLREVQEKKRQQDPAGGLKRRLEETILPEVDLREAAVPDVMEFLRSESRDRSRDKTPINIVWHVPPEQKLPKITLNLKNVPLIDVLRYATDLARLNYRIDAHAVVISLPEKVAPSPASSNVKPQ